MLKIRNLNLGEDQEGYWIFLQSTYVDEVWPSLLLDSVIAGAVLK